MMNFMLTWRQQQPAVYLHSNRHFNTSFIVLNAEFIIVNTKFINFNENRYWSKPHLVEEHEKHQRQQCDLYIIKSSFFSAEFIMIFSQSRTHCHAY